MEEKLKGKELVVTKVDPEGNVELSYGSSSMRGLNLVTALAVPVFLVSCGTSMVSAKAAGASDEWSLFLSMFIALTAAGLVGHFLSHRKEKITIVKGKGIKFLKQELPFSSIDQFYKKETEITKVVRNQTVNMTFVEIRARVRGRDIAITRGVPPFVADDIYEKISSYR